jgi:hypothetical protein
MGIVCTFDKVSPTLYSYTNCLNNLQTSGLNKMQVVIALNSSPGWDDPNPAGGPYMHEQPVLWDGSVTNPKWHLDMYDSTYFANLNQVIADAAARGIVVEVVLVDQWDGNSTHGPWDTTRNYNSAGFPSTHKALVTSYENGAAGTDTTPAVQLARGLQKNLIAHVVAALSANPNLYWEISNEADLVPAGQTAPDLMGLILWHFDIARIISTNDPKHHPIGVNFVTQDALNQILAGAIPKVQIVNGHYAQLSNPVTGQPTEGALPMIRDYLAGPLGNLNLAFGFNEGKASPNPSTAGARAEAWEFMLDEGATYDNYNLNAFTGATTAIRGYLSLLASFLQPYAPYYSNSQIARSTGSTPAWATGLSSPGTHTAEDTLGQTYWGAMTFRRQVYGLYLHHSCIPTTSTGGRYKPVCNKVASRYQETLNLIPGDLAGSFKVEWFTPDQGTPICTQLLTWPGSGSVPITSPHYTYDLALRLTRCTGASCPPAADCSTTTAAVCPTDAWPDSGTCP